MKFFALLVHAVSPGEAVLERRVSGGGFDDLLAFALIAGAAKAAGFL
jgi:hypothetical protein